MKFSLISDNHDTAVGLRLAGIEGVVVHGREQALEALSAAMNESDTAIVLITEGLAGCCRAELDDLRLNCSQPLIVEIPDRHSEGRQSSVLRYVREAVGITV